MNRPSDRHRYLVHFITNASPRDVHDYATAKGWEHARICELPQWLLYYPDHTKPVEMVIPKIAGWRKPWRVYAREALEAIACIEGITLRQADTEFHLWLDQKSQG